MHYSAFVNNTEVVENLRDKNVFGLTLFYLFNLLKHNAH